MGRLLKLTPSELGEGRHRLEQVNTVQADPPNLLSPQWPWIPCVIEPPAPLAVAGCAQGSPIPFTNSSSVGLPQDSEKQL